ncbi:PAS domain-containing protein [Magnetospirillum fulvum]|uniref:Chemotaxis sensory transducer n=1 Tax=Magnetospirillum fulvum MGU-K5 TaxID=1316936 RepID=S9SDV0_MAGFU|nr:PAS domain-containing protein [Magnetospirillum fulvum]EPY02919.1 chemotaxis sensory transducer [Magnetospirillum fulvum MGU-K5]
MPNAIRLTGIEKFFDEDSVIVTKTDQRGVITYANKTFLEVSEYFEKDVVGKPHNMIRHPDMPHCIFRKMWSRIKSGKEIFAYVVNRTKLGNHYWVLAHVTPSFNTEQQIVGFHSNRRVPDRTSLTEVIVPLYQKLSALEREVPDLDTGITVADSYLRKMLQEKGIGYDQFIFSI